jgi:hypothetical protein
MTQPFHPTPRQAPWSGLATGLVLLLALVAPASAQVSSETVYFLQPDGRSYLLERSLRTAASSHRFYLDKAIRQQDLRHVEPREFGWDDSSREDLNILTFDSGGFTVIFPGELKAPQLEARGGGEFLYRSWDGSKNADGRFGMWYSPDDFDDFSYTWIFPDNIELLSYKANRNGDWVRRGSAVSFFASKVNNLTFELRYRVTRPATVPAAACPQPATPAPAPVTACPDPAPQRTDAGGCALDCDGDGVSNRLDACPGSPSGNVVDRRGCEVRVGGDSDGDGVDDARDLCRGTAAGARVDRAGCSLDTDKDGVPDGVDRCPATPEETVVDANGCRMSGE